MIEFLREEIMALCPRDVVDIGMPRGVNKNRLMGPPIIELEFQKDTLYPHIIIGGECIQLKMKRKRPTLCERP